MTKHIFLIITLLFTSVCAKADDFSNKPKADINITGHVIDKKSGEHLPYITVAIKGTTIGTTTDATGHYFLKGLPVGTFTIEARFVGYKSQSFEIKLEQGKTYEVNRGT